MKLQCSSCSLVDPMIYNHHQKYPVDIGGDYSDPWNDRSIPVDPPLPPGDYQDLLDLLYSSRSPWRLELSHISQYDLCLNHLCQTRSGGLKL